MTLIAVFQEYDVPLLLGDVLVTTCFNEERHFKKIEKISPNFVVGWTGIFGNAKILLSDLFTKFNGLIVTKQTIEEYLVNYDVSRFYKKKEEKSLILSGWIIDDFGKHPFVWDSDNNKYGIKRILSEKGSRYIRGTGGAFFSSLLNEKPRVQKIATENLIESAKLTLLTEMLYLTIGEYLSNDKSWRNKFGFGYEALLYYENSFNYLDNIAYLVLDVFYDGNLQFQSYKVADGRITRYKNFGSFSVFDERKINNDITQQYYVGKVYRDIERDVALLFSINSKGYQLTSPEYICLGFRYFVNEKPFDIGSLIAKRDNQMVKIKSVNQKVYLYFSRDLIQYLQKAIIDTLATKPRI